MTHGNLCLEEGGVCSRDYFFLVYPSSCPRVHTGLIFHENPTLLGRHSASRAAVVWVSRGVGSPAPGSGYVCSYGGTS